MIFTFEKRKDSFYGSQLKDEILSTLASRADKLFPNIIKTAYKEYDYQKEKKNQAYENNYNDYYIFDFDYLVLNKPSKTTNNLSKTFLNQKNCHIRSHCRLSSTPLL